MAKKKTQSAQAEMLPDAPARNQPITETIETNYMPYVMSVIISRAIPEIDGFKPAHRKILYTMYKMGLMSGPRTKSANVVGQTMRLHPHGDAAIYETMVRLTKDHEALLHPFVDSKGSFGKQYSADAFAAPRYTEVRLMPICAEIFSGIDRNAINMIDNYDGTTKEPELLPTTFPNILVTPNKGIAVGMASNICSFNLAEICDGTIEVLKNPTVDVDRILELVKAPDFAGGGNLIYNRESLTEVYKTGVGSVRLRARYTYDPAANCIDVVEIPYSTSIDAIIKKITDMIKEGKLKEVVDIRDEIDLSGFKLTMAISMCSLTRCPAQWGSLTFSRSGLPSVSVVCAGSLPLIWVRKRRNCICFWVWGRSFWILTKPYASSGRQSLKKMWLRTKRKDKV